jgi:hypothetical protein
VERLKRTVVNVALHAEGADRSKLDTIRGTIAALHWMKGVPRTPSHTSEVPGGAGLRGGRNRRS